MQQSTRQQRAERSVFIPMIESSAQDAHLKRVFDRIDTDEDGKISMNELRNAIDWEHFKDNATQCIMEICDTNNPDFLDSNEFLGMMRRKDMGKLVAHLINRYLIVVVPQKSSIGSRILAECMLLISIIEITLFAIDVMCKNHTEATGPIAAILMYDPQKRYQAWRFITYMQVHSGFEHLVWNLQIQIALGMPLEMIHKWWHVAIVYVAGVLGGSLTTSIFDPTVKLVGASGGVFALATAHISTTIMNWPEMDYLTMVMIVLLIGCNICAIIINGFDENIGFMAHMGGAAAGLLVGIIVFQERNRNLKLWQKNLWWIAVSVLLSLMTMALQTHIFYTDNFPPVK